MKGKKAREHAIGHAPIRVLLPSHHHEAVGADAVRLAADHSTATRHAISGARAPADATHQLRNRRLFGATRKHSVGSRHCTARARTRSCARIHHRLHARHCSIARHTSACRHAPASDTGSGGTEDGATKSRDLTPNSRPRLDLAGMGEGVENDILGVLFGGGRDDGGAVMGGPGVGVGMGGCEVRQGWSG